GRPPRAGTMIGLGNAVADRDSVALAEAAVRSELGASYDWTR
ncbi:spermidine synthase, partial [Burkholderia thailandensis]|nr:spermidine synthase [Burkholderia thailandensis]